VPRSHAYQNAQGRKWHSHNHRFGDIRPVCITYYQKYTNCTIVAETLLCISKSLTT
uniref:Uncharacterized protein n=1 Tax=Amphimedon queenslandica TaxID=400682 RepID=A0A1X7V5W4_AMPQE